MSPPDTPGYQVVETDRPFTGTVVGLRVDHIRAPDGATSTREVVEHGGAVAGLVVDEAGRVVLVEQWRQPMGRRMLEVLAGRYDQPGETVEAALRRELAEEMGLTGGQVTWLTTFATTPGWSTELLDLYLVQGARPLPDGRPTPQWEEAGLRVVTLDYAEALERTTSGEIADGKTLVALGLYGLLQAGVWQPTADGAPSAQVPAERAGHPGTTPT